MKMNLKVITAQTLREAADSFSLQTNLAPYRPHHTLKAAHCIEMLEMSRASRKFNHCTFDCPAIILILNLLVELNIGSGDSKNFHRAVAKMTPYFHKEIFAPGAIGEP